MPCRRFLISGTAIRRASDNRRTVAGSPFFHNVHALKRQANAMKPAAGAIISTSDGTRSNPDFVAGRFIATRSSGLHLLSMPSGVQRSISRATSGRARRATDLIFCERAFPRGKAEINQEKSHVHARLEHLSAAAHRPDRGN